MIPEYDLDNPSTWTTIDLRDAISESEEKAFQKSLVGIAGLNPFGEPNLTLRWGVTYRDGMILDDKPKYYLFSRDPILIGHRYRDNDEWCSVKELASVPKDKISIPVYSEPHLGERRFIVEIWRSPEFLARSGRYQQLSDNGDTLTYFQCRGCGERVQVPMGTENLDIERVCPSCNSKRVSL